MTKVKVGVNGFGTIGKRVAEAVSKQEDMEIVGILDIAPTIAVRANALRTKFQLYCAVADRASLLEEAGLKVQGLLSDLLEKVDIMVDACPPGIGAKNKLIYEKTGVKGVFQGGEKAEEQFCQVKSFNALANYKDALGKDYVRVVSCNTTGIIRTTWAVDQIYDIENAVAVIVRRAMDPVEPWTHRGAFDAVKPSPVPSHQGIDMKFAMPHVNITTMVVTIPTTRAHENVIAMRLKEKPSRDAVLQAFHKTPRIKIWKIDNGFQHTSQILEFHRDTGRLRHDMPEVAVWDETVFTEGKNVYWIQMVHQEAIVIPENIDAIRAMMEIERDPMVSIAKTNKAMGIE